MNGLINETAVKVEGLTVAYDNNPALWDVSVDFPKGKLIAVMGPNGSGKTTLIKTMLGLVKPVTGRVIFAKTKYKNILRSGEIGYIPQSESVDWDYPSTALDVVLMGAYGRLGWIRRPSKNDVSAALDALDKVGISELSSRQISQLSGGQQQRVFLARALMQDSSIYFLDEPFKGVDAQTEKVIVKLLKALRDGGRTIIAAHHDLATVKEYFDRVVIINKRIIADGEVPEVFTEENLGKAYRGAGATEGRKN